jgi:hypothetical protein
MTFMQIEIDTSSRLDKSGDTVFGFSDHIEMAVILRQTTRDQCMEKLKGRRLSKELRIFAACIYLLIDNYLDDITGIRIDQEYPEHEGEIKRYLANIIAVHRPSVLLREGFIKIVSIGKRSRAHEIAWEVFRKQRKADRILKIQDILRLLAK